MHPDTTQVLRGQWPDPHKPCPGKPLVLEAIALSRQVAVVVGPVLVE